MDKLIYSDLCKRAQKKQLLCEKYKKTYSPNGKIELLIVGESPPMGDSYFYIPDNLNRRHQGLPSKIFRSLFNASTKIDKEQCVSFLKKFQKSNFFLTDIVPYPIDCLIPSKRAEVISEGIDSFRNRMTSLKLSKSCYKVMILPSTTYKELQKQRYMTARKILEELSFEIIRWSQTEEKLRKIAEKLKTKNLL